MACLLAATLESCPVAGAKERDHTLAIVVAAVTGGVIMAALGVYCYMGIKKTPKYEQIN